MNYDQFSRVLEEIALSVWHGSGRATTLSQIEEHCRSSRLSPLLEVFQEGVKAGVSRLLTAFYFRQHGVQQTTGEETFEFTHKSFAEYLTARRILRAARRMHDELRRREENLDSGWDERDALKHWAEVCGPTPIAGYHLQFLDGEIPHCEISIIRAWQLMFCALIGQMLRHGMPMEQLSSLRSYRQMSRQARNAEEALLFLLSSCALQTRTISHVDWPDERSLSAWISRLTTAREDDESELALERLFYLDLHKCRLNTADFFQADFRYSDLSAANCNFAAMVGANFSYAN